MLLLDQIFTYPIKMLSRLPFILLLSLFCVHTSEAKCCRGHSGGGDYPITCADGSHAGACCGNGACNIFCCNCDRGCRGDRRGKRAINDVEDLERFANYDLNRDGVIDFSEANSKMGGMLDNSTFYDLDLDMDGVISTNEFDEDLS